MAVNAAAIAEAVGAFFASPVPGVAAVYLYGSTVRGTASPRSDVDVAVLFAKVPARTLDSLPAELADRLQEALGRPVDMIVLNHAPADLVHRVLRDGVLIRDDNPVARVAFEVQSRNEYFDLAPIRERYRRSAGSEATHR